MDNRGVTQNTRRQTHALFSIYVILPSLVILDTIFYSKQISDVMVLTKTNSQIVSDQSKRTCSIEYNGFKPIFEIQDWVCGAIYYGVERTILVVLACFAYDKGTYLVYAHQCGEMLFSLIWDSNLDLIRSMTGPMTHFISDPASYAQSYAPPICVMYTCGVVNYFL